MSQKYPPHGEVSRLTAGCFSSSMRRRSPAAHTMRSMRVLLISTYELGHQPIHLGTPARALRDAGHDVQCLDLASTSWSEGVIDRADALAFSTPMHTALRLAAEAAKQVKARHPHLPIAAYGLYAVNTEGLPFDRSLAGEYQAELLAWIESLSTSSPVHGATSFRGRGDSVVPDRTDLLPLENYAQLSHGSELRLVGAVETSHGCIHRCRHCPLPTVYDGRIRIVGQDVVLADIAQLAEAGATHITFADADFFNAPKHSMRIVDEMHGRFPRLTYDATIKVEHLLKHRGLIQRLTKTGCLFIVSAFETLNDEILTILDKGHTAAQASAAVHAVRSEGLDLRPTWLPFTPWTVLDDVLDMFSFIAAHDLAGSTDPIQMGIRLLVPRTSLLADHPSFRPYRGSYDEESLGYLWASRDPELDALAGQLALIAEANVDEAPAHVFAEMWREVLRTGGRDESVAETIPIEAIEGRPRLTEPWFC